jgi:hypothetical protein
MAGDKLRKRIKSHKAPSYNKGKQVDLHVTRVGVRGSSRLQATQTSRYQAGIEVKLQTQARANHFVSQPHLTYRATPLRSTTPREASSRFQSRQMTPTTSSLRAHDLSKLRVRQGMLSLGELSPGTACHLILSKCLALAYHGTRTHLVVSTRQRIF